MTEEDRARERLSRVLDPLVDELLGLSDEEIVAEVLEDGESPGEVASDMASVLSEAVRAAGKRRLANARAELNGLRALRTPTLLAGLSVQQKELLLRHFAANDNPLQKRLTMAARNGTGMSEAEVDSVLLDLVELGALPMEMLKQ